jgi:hypothetical protein
MATEAEPAKKRYTGQAVKMNLMSYLFEIWPQNEVRVTRERSTHHLQESVTISGPSPLPTVSLTFKHLYTALTFE